MEKQEAGCLETDWSVWESLPPLYKLFTEAFKDTGDAEICAEAPLY